MRLTVRTAAGQLVELRISLATGTLIIRKPLWIYLLTPYKHRLRLILLNRSGSIASKFDSTFGSGQFHILCKFHIIVHEDSVLRCSPFGEIRHALSILQLQLFFHTRQSILVSSIFKSLAKLLYNDNHT